MNGLMLACCRGVYSVAARGKGPATHMFSRVDEHTNMPNNSAVMGLLLCGFWGLYFYLSNLAGTWEPQDGLHGHDLRERPLPV